ncbi:MAG TPA: PSD1 and planctomycete cytochrome C domain-containing protein [Bryobacteraceae bacterium]|nr:PSD1 and planctomycete cytochrome C domain-containing protein [Bryobacteraceae bacterium]
MRLLPRLVTFSVSIAAVLAADADRISFNRDIRPIMSDTCFRCHGPDRSSRMAGMRLDLREQATKPVPSGRTPIVPGDPAKSEIIERIFSTGARIMPPAYAHKPLTEKQKETIREWVAQGAVYEGHWAYQPIRRPEPPKIADASRIRNPIDNFIQDRLAREGLKPSELADKPTLLRRVSFDLTGLPPTAEEVRAFLADNSPDAYEKVVDRLLASPRYAEQQTMHWLDAVRYADTCGFHGDNPIPAWPYRDYVLNAFLHDEPFDQFTREQIAGDLIPNATVEQRVASAYNRLNPTSAEGGLQPKEYLAKYGADRVRTLSAVWLGSTLGCAECHDHKFDPFLTKDFYAMKAFFADVQETGLMPDRGAKAWGAQLELSTDQQKRQLADLDAKIAAANARIDDKASKFAASEAAWESDLKKRWLAGELQWTWQHPTAARSIEGATLTIYNEQPIESNYYLDGSLKTDRKPGDGLVVASGKNPDNETYIVTLHPGAGVWNQLGLDVAQDESLPGARYARGADRFLLSEIEARVEEAGQTARKLTFTMATVNDTPPPVSSINDPSMPPLAAIDGDLRTSWGIRFGEARDPFLALRFAEPLKTDAETRIIVTLRHESELRKAVIGRFRLALAADRYAWPPVADAGKRARTKDWSSGLPEEVMKALRRPAEDRDANERAALRDYRIWSELASDYADREQLSTARGLLDASIAHVITTVSVDPRVTHILPRANWMDDSQPIVEPAIPQFLGVLNTKGERATRLDLANWLVSPQNPLTARAFANRTWREFFGVGISKVLDDLGSQGEWPTHPELLDWLASEFRHPEYEAAGAHDWDVKHLIRLIVTSYTYQQSSLPQPGDTKDPENRLLAHQNRYRVDAENVRDAALEVSGLLVEKLGGPSVNPVEPPHYLAALNFPKREYSASHGADLYRRGIYTTWQRTYLHPSLLNFDAPTREECTVNRSTSNTPLQALDLLNDPIYVEAARVFAQNAIGGAAGFDARLDYIFNQALNRAPSAGERSILRGLYDRNLERFRANGASASELLRVGEAPLAHNEDPVELAALTTITRAVLNLHELITRN